MILLKKLKKAAAAVLSLALLFSLAACSDKTANEKYKTIKTYGSDEYVLSFREGDKTAEFVEAALKALAEDGTVGRLSAKWFGKDVTHFKTDVTALSALGAIPEKSVAFGVSASAFPMSAKETDDTYTGFDVELAEAVCALLGWELVFRAIDTAEVYVELSSGNIDCACGGVTKSLGAGGQFYMTDGYMETWAALVAPSRRRGLSVRSFKGGTLAVCGDVAPQSALDSEAELGETFGSILRAAGDSRSVFTLLDNGRCDAILTDRAAVLYFGM